MPVPVDCCSILIPRETTKQNDQEISMTFTKPSRAIQSLFPTLVAPTNVANLESPETYTGLAGFHKYWGKKPVESLSCLIENCAGEGDIVLDPFLGSGLISRECLKRSRRFAGVDINPFSVEPRIIIA